MKKDKRIRTYGRPPFASLHSMLLKSKKETEWTGSRKFSYRNGSRGLVVLPTLGTPSSDPSLWAKIVKERRASTQLRQPREHLSLYFWNEIGTSDKINFDSHVAKKATSSSGSLCLSPASIFWACQDKGSNSLNLWRTQEAKCAHFSQIAFELVLNRRVANRRDR
ncbi:hypothetical protein V6N13_090575 [Hibiscus sabdariffa]|uniref:Uncharacterized protein n=1 Tax=Hibiscus sabdariffa TaxID=183260 RepID=A0ABR2NY34_9ROSI